MAEDDQYSLPAISEEASVDFLESRSLEELEDGVRRMQAVGDIMALVQGLAIIKIENEGLWREAEFPNLRAYRIDQAARLRMPKSTISDRRKTAESWMKYKKLLSKIDMVGHVAKLRALDDAMRVHKDRRLVLQHFLDDSYRAFIRFAGEERAPDSDLPDVEFSMRGGQVALDGKAVMQLDPSLPDEERGFLADALRSAYRARRGGCLAHIVAVYDQGEARAVDNFLKKRRASR